MARGGTCALPALLHCLQNPKWTQGAPKIADGVWKVVYLEVFGHSKQLLLNKYFDPSTPSMRKVDDGEKKREKNVVFSGPYVIASSRSPERWNAARSGQN